MEVTLKTTFIPICSIIHGTYTYSHVTFAASAFSKVSQLTLNLDQEGEKFKQDFAVYIRSVVKTLASK